MFTRTLNRFLHEAKLNTILYSIILLMTAVFLMVQFYIIENYSALIKDDNTIIENTITDQFIRLNIISIGLSILACLVLGYMVSYLFRVGVTRKIGEMTHIIEQNIHGKSRSLKAQGQEDELYILLGQIEEIILFDKDRHSLNFELIRTRIEAEISNKAKSEFLANMSHELRTPLNAIIGFSEIMMSDQLSRDLECNFKEYARDIHNSGIYLLHIIDQILDLSNVESGNMILIPRSVELRNTADKSIKLLEGLAQEKSISIQNNISRKFPVFYGDERMLQKILISILSNAVKFTLEAGIVVIDADVRADGSFCISIRDNGIGIEQDYLEKIASSFAQVEDAYTRDHPGVGLGLTLVNAFMGLYEGSMRIKSIVGLGTTILLVFPATCLLTDGCEDKVTEEDMGPVLKMTSQ